METEDLSSFNRSRNLLQGPPPPPFSPPPPPDGWTRTQFAYIGIYDSVLSTGQTGDQTFTSEGKWSDAAINAADFSFIEFIPVDSYPTQYFRLDYITYGSQTVRYPTQWAHSLADAKAGTWQTPPNAQSLYEICNFGKAHFAGNAWSGFGSGLGVGCQMGPNIRDSGVLKGAVRLYGYQTPGPPPPSPSPPPPAPPPPDGWTRTQFAYIGIYDSVLSTGQTGDQTFTSEGKWSDAAINAADFSFIEFIPVDSYPTQYFRLDYITYGSQTVRYPTQWAHSLADAKAGTWQTPPNAQSLYEICNFGKAHFAGNAWSGFGSGLGVGCQMGPNIRDSGVLKGNTSLAHDINNDTYWNPDDTMCALGSNDWWLKLDLMVEMTVSTVGIVPYGDFVHDVSAYDFYICDPKPGLGVDPDYQQSQYYRPATTKIATTCTSKLAACGATAGAYTEQTCNGWGDATVGQYFAIHITALAGAYLIPYVPGEPFIKEFNLYGFGGSASLRSLSTCVDNGYGTKPVLTDGLYLFPDSVFDGLY
ncbi:hypothetical protein CYMTET_56423 [Cymbomonas tetramitiformis]|uniref:Uncharacterized protein n=1 Tax=Cymbomonas tetramitiformis TaxID=36881 RepID=A0AAE0BBB5_9CHLO|nr:hypothetical protein CYMTET_56423 [Cymbomonas tetramitiformis]